jgi:hypothetical protein
MKWIGETVPVGVRTLGCVGLFNGREYLFKKRSKNAPRIGLVVAQITS